MIVTSTMCLAVEARRLAVPDFDARPIQAGMGGDPWRVAVASVLLCRCRGTQVRPVLRQLLTLCTSPAALAAIDTGQLETTVRPCGLHQQRARQLTRMSSLWYTMWDSLRRLPGCGAYVNDAAGVFCFDCKVLETSDHALRKYVSASQDPSGTLPDRERVEYPSEDCEESVCAFCGADLHYGCYCHEDIVG